MQLESCRLINKIGPKLNRPNLLAICALKCLVVVLLLQSLTFSQVMLSNLLRGSIRFKHLLAVVLSLNLNVFFT